jgi:hypothetical protein
MFMVTHHIIHSPLGFHLANHFFIPTPPSIFKQPTISTLILIHIQIYTHTYTSLTSISLQSHLTSTTYPSTMKFLFAYIALFFPVTILALGNAVILNSSPHTIYAWSVGAAISARQIIVPGTSLLHTPLISPFILTNPTGGLYLEPLHSDPRSGGIALKLTTTPDGLLDGSPQQIFAYNVDGDKVWYDLSSVFGEPFKGSRIEVTSSTGEAIVWDKGVDIGGNHVKSAGSGENVWCTIYG